MKKINVALINNVQYCKFPKGINNITEFIEFLNENYHSFVELEFLIEEGCVAPFYIEEDLKIEKQYWNPSNIRLVKEAEVSILRRWENEVGGINHIHGYGGNGRDMFDGLMESEGVKPTDRMILKEYIDNMYTCMCAADIIISRAGANSICEFLALRKPALLIPLSAAASRGDQILNAASFEAQGYSMVISEDDLTKEFLVAKVQELYCNRNSYIEAMKNSEQSDSIKTIMGLIEEFS